MVDVLHKRCKCGKARAIYNEPNEEKEDGDSWMDDPENYWNID